MSDTEASDLQSLISLSESVSGYDEVEQKDRALRMRNYNSDGGKNMVHPYYSDEDVMKQYNNANNAKDSNCPQRNSLSDTSASTLNKDDVTTQSNGRNICVIVRHYQENTIKIDIGTHDTIGKLKDSIHDRTGIVSNNQMLSYCGKVLGVASNKRTLYDFNICEDGCIVDCSVRLKAATKQCIVHFHNSIKTPDYLNLKFPKLTMDALNESLNKNDGSKNPPKSKEGVIIPWVIDYNDNTTVDDLLCVIRKVDWFEQIEVKNLVATRFPDAQYHWNHLTSNIRKLWHVRLQSNATTCLCESSQKVLDFELNTMPTPNFTIVFELNKNLNTKMSDIYNLFIADNYIISFNYICDSLQVSSSSRDASRSGSTGGARGAGAGAGAGRAGSQQNGRNQTQLDLCRKYSNWDKMASAKLCDFLYHEIILDRKLAPILRSGIIPIKLVLSRSEFYCSDLVLAIDSNKRDLERKLAKMQMKDFKQLIEHHVKKIQIRNITEQFVDGSINYTFQTGVDGFNASLKKAFQNKNLLKFHILYPKICFNILVERVSNNSSVTTKASENSVKSENKQNCKNKSPDLANTCDSCKCSAGVANSSKAAITKKEHNYEHYIYYDECRHGSQPHLFRVDAVKKRFDEVKLNSLDGEDDEKKACGCVDGTHGVCGVQGVHAVDAEGDRSGRRMRDLIGMIDGKIVENSFEYEITHSQSKYLELSFDLKLNRLPFADTIKVSRIRNVSTMDSEDTVDSKESDLLDDMKCAICLELVKYHNYARLSHCRHKFHFDCICNNVKYSQDNRCPLCRTSFTIIQQKRRIKSKHKRNSSKYVLKAENFNKLINRNGNDLGYDYYDLSDSEAEEDGGNNNINNNESYREWMRSMNLEPQRCDTCNVAINVNDRNFDIDNYLHCVACGTWYHTACTDASLFAQCNQCLRCIHCACAENDDEWLRYPVRPNSEMASTWVHVPCQQQEDPTM